MTKLVVLLLLLALPVLAAPRTQPVELGDVQWLRSYAAAREQAKIKGRALLVLFDEVPGCANCTGFGERVLSDPLVVEAAEDLFVPVAIFNNKPGEDQRTLEEFNEPAWNNPVIRVVDAATKKDLAPRMASFDSVASVARTMAAALESRRQRVPGYLRLLAATPTPETRTEKAVFSMYCFWEGEAKLGALDGVVATTAGFMNGEEAVEVEFDPATLPFGDLVKSAKKLDCLHHVYTRSAAQQEKARALVGNLATESAAAFRPSDADSKYHIKKSRLKDVKMPPLQASKVNSALALHGAAEAESLLSPRQLAGLN